MWLGFLWVEALSAGSSPRRATYFLCSAKESRQRKAAPLAVALRAACDARSWSGAAELALFASLSPLKQRQRVSLRKRACCAARPPHALRFSARPEGVLNSSLGPSLRSALAFLPLPLGEAWPVLSLSKEGEGKPPLLIARSPAQSPEAVFQYQNRSCSRLPHMRWRCISLESIVRRRRVGACTHAFARVLAKPLTTARPAPHWPAQRVRPA